MEIDQARIFSSRLMLIVEEILSLNFEIVVHKRKYEIVFEIDYDDLKEIKINHSWKLTAFINLLPLKIKMLKLNV